MRSIKDDNKILYLPISSSVTPRGFSTYSTNLGIKDQTLDFTVIYSDVPAKAAAVFTQNHFCGSPISVGKENVADGVLQCFMVNSKNANVATGDQGIANVKEMIHVLSEDLNIPFSNILPSSTGIIGHQLPMEKIRSGLIEIKDKLKPGGFDTAAKAIMTTDTFPKIRACKIGDTTLLGIAKGSGMIEPNMATLLAYFVTDADIPSAILTEIFRKSVNHSFNMVSIDTDTSTSDTAAIMANGLAGRVNLQEFENALMTMSVDLAKEIAKDGEGATKLLEVTVTDAENFIQAKQVAKSIVNSPLIKTAAFGADPNWGRVAMAIGKCEGEKNIDPDKVSISFGPLEVYKGKPLKNINLAELKKYFFQETIDIQVSLGLGNSQATVWGCDFTYDYIRINGKYTT
ncbi:bifunctional glutamate N-acetyltransferase/amino-acid acetyltransferase ArgJ [Peribacillus sp. TH14]|uniref:bifunctional glutamate N-acetyltransferase/amino-acid acetyltransferase ArgJ n=1 Tax=Peribacillus sp. TH14 TaxID=2798481 RepID=UPI00191200E8|nr:bifunctional glutamate N-acetyltransferase/amino-acid acetyltransferase ArgJ [Peribacillus sp. TH14]MBK5501394.1 bifunctional glutamate N-acetyltransferase/amino-acid acetyltransferase ArgJ [Peribacillus sp. TH14]